MGSNEKEEEEFFLRGYERAALCNGEVKCITFVLQKSVKYTLVCLLAENVFTVAHRLP